MSINVPLTRARRQLRKIPGAALVWRLVNKAIHAAFRSPRTRYCIPRIVGQVTYPFLAHRAPLRGYYAKTRDSLRHSNGRCIVLEPQSLTGDPSCPDTFEAELFTAVIPRGRSLYDCGVVVSPNHNLLADVSWEGYEAVSDAKNHPAMYKLRLPPIKHVAGRVAIITSINADNYYHWMFDILPRFEILQKSGLTADYYLINSTNRFQKECLQVLNIPIERILNPTKSTHIEADELIVPSLLGPVFKMTPQPQACKYLRSTFLPLVKAQKAHRALYITRDDARNRRVINEAEVKAEVTSLGFEVVSLSNVPVLRQVELFSEASIIVGPHGAGFTNAVFCPLNAVLIELMPEKRPIGCFERLARFVGMRYHSIVGTDRGISEDRLYTDDHAVDITVLRKVLRQFA